eukprot:2773225-Pleurochrysis_carterae.AAC.2
MAAALTRKAAGKGRVGSKKAVDLCKWFKYSLNQRKIDPNLAGLELAAAEEKLLVKWNAVPLSGVYFDAPAAAVAPAEVSAASHSATSACGGWLIESKYPYGS